MHTRYPEPAAPPPCSSPKLVHALQPRQLKRQSLKRGQSWKHIDMRARDEDRRLWHPRWPPTPQSFVLVSARRMNMRACTPRRLEGPIKSALLGHARSCAHAHPAHTPPPRRPALCAAGASAHSGHYYTYARPSHIPGRAGGAAAGPRPVCPLTFLFFTHVLYFSFFINTRCRSFVRHFLAKQRHAVFVSVNVTWRDPT